MTNVVSALKSEMVRIARKEIRSSTTDLRSTVTGQRKTIAQLRRQIQELERAVRRTGKARGAAVEELDGQQGDTVSSHRFSAKGLAMHRKRLGLSAADFAKLVGCSGLSVYHWESGKSRPRAAQLEKIAAARALGKREAQARLEALAPSHKPTTKRAASKRRLIKKLPTVRQSSRRASKAA